MRLKVRAKETSEGDQKSEFQSFQSRGRTFITLYVDLALNGINIIHLNNSQFQLYPSHPFFPLKEIKQHLKKSQRSMSTPACYSTETFLGTKMCDFLSAHRHLRPAPPKEGNKCPLFSQSGLFKDRWPHADFFFFSPVFFSNCFRLQHELLLQTALGATLPSSARSSGGRGRVRVVCKERSGRSQPLQSH